MTPIKLTLRNFLSYKEPAPLDFQQFNLAVISGNNGVGKSSILEAITWAIWGKTRAGSDDDLIHLGTNGALVEFIFEHEGIFYRIIRKRHHLRRTKQSILEFQVKEKNNTLIDDGWRSITESTLKSTQEKIIQILKIPYEIFINSSYLRQNHADEFTIKTPAERKEILSEVLGLNYYEELSTRARQKEKDISEKIKLLNFQIEDLQIQASRKKEVENNINKTQSAIDKLSIKQQRLKKIIASLEKERHNYLLLKEELENLRQKYLEGKNDLIQYQSERTNYQNEIKQFEKKLSNKNIILKKYYRLLSLEKEVEKENLKFKNYSEIIQKIRLIEHLKADLENNTKRLGKIATCPMCLRPMKKNETIEIIQHLKKEFNSKHSHQFQILQKHIKNIAYKENHHLEIQQEFKRLQGFRDEKQSLDLAQNNLTNSKNNLKRVTATILKINKEIQEIASKGKKITKFLPTLEKVNLRWEEENQRETQITQEILNIQESLGGLKQEYEKIKQDEQKIKALEKEDSQLKKQGIIFNELSIAFGKKGMQAMIIEQSLTSIEEEANKIIKKITDGRLSIKFITQKEKKSNQEEVIETLEIKIADEIGERDYEMYSGGEAFRINFAVRIALSKLLAARIGTHLKFLAIDEGFGVLDAPGREDLAEAINAISPDFEKILVITHLQELKDLFPAQIMVTKDENGSNFEIMNV